MYVSSTAHKANGLSLGRTMEAPPQTFADNINRNDISTDGEYWVPSSFATWNLFSTEDWLIAV